MRGYRKTAARAGTRGGGKGDDTKRDTLISHVLTGNASHIAQDKGLISDGLKQDALAALLKRAMDVAEREDQTIADLASLSLQYASLMNRGCGKEIVLQPWPRGDCWLMIRDADGSAALEYQGDFANAFRLALLHSVYGGDDVRGAPINISGCCDE